jgi:hypothetical protein
MVERAYVLQGCSLPLSRGASCWIMWVSALVRRFGCLHPTWKDTLSCQIAEETPASKRERVSEGLTLTDAHHGEFFRVLLLDTGSVRIDFRSRCRPPMHDRDLCAGTHDFSGSCATSSGVRADVLSHTDPGNPLMTPLCRRWSRGTS